MSNKPHDFSESLSLPPPAVIRVAAQSQVSRKMFSRILGIPVLLGAAVAVPYFATNGPEGLKQWWSSMGVDNSEATPDWPELSALDRWDTAPRGPGHEIYPVSTPLEGNPSLSLEEVFRFDVSKEWVYERWARKSTALAELGLYGVRIPLVTGTEIHDLAGSLTYFFDQYGKVQRISFKGNTGDTTKVVALAQANGLEPKATAVVGEQLFQIKRGNDTFSELHTRPSSVLWSSSPHDSFAVELDLQRPEATTPLASKLPPLPEVKIPPATTETENEQNAEIEKKGFRESMKAFFPRSRVPSEQVESLEKRDRIW